MQKLICVPLAYQNEQKRAFSSSSEILDFENRTIIKGDMAQNGLEGEIQAVDHGLCIHLLLELWACLNIIPFHLEQSTFLIEFLQARH